MFSLFFKTKRSAQSQKKHGKTTVEAAPPTSNNSTSIDRPSIDRPSLFPNTLPQPTCSPPSNSLLWTPVPRGQAETARIVSGDPSAICALSHVISKAERLAKIVPELNMRGLAATQRLLKTGGADASELIAHQARAKERINARRNRMVTMLPTPSVQVSIRITAPRFPANAGYESCKAGFEKCSTCYDIGTKTSFPIMRPVPLGYDPASPASICSSFAKTFSEEASSLASVYGTEDEDEDEGEICQVTRLGVVHKGAKVVGIGSAKSPSPSMFPQVRPLTIVRPAVPSIKKPTCYSFPSDSIPRPDSPTLPAEVPAPLFSKRK